MFIFVQKYYFFSFIANKNCYFLYISDIFLMQMQDALLFSVLLTIRHLWVYLKLERVDASILAWLGQARLANQLLTQRIIKVTLPSVALINIVFFLKGLRNNYFVIFKTKQFMGNIIKTIESLSKPRLVDVTHAKTSQLAVVAS